MGCYLVEHSKKGFEMGPMKALLIAMVSRKAVNSIACH
jgi:hypothetical protein